MEENQEQQQAEAPRESSWFHANRWGVVAVILLLVAAGWALTYGRRQGAMINRLASHDAEVNATIGQMQSELNIITAKLSEISAAQTAEASGQEGANRAAAQRAAADANRLKQMQTRLEQQQKQMKATEADVAKTRSDLEGNISSTRDELNGSIAKTHEELVALQKRGERNYFEFDLAKTKQFQRSGPVMLSLRKTDEKHQHLDLAMIVNDNSLTKKNVNLYEPIWIYDRSETPVQVVVNKIGRDRVHGYVSAPKYSPVDIAGGATPVSALSPAPNANPASNSPLQ